VGRRQEVEIGPMSGQANVHYWLASRGLPATPELVSEICRRAKESRRVLSEAEVLACCRRPER
ncbi:MAG TPA: 2-isopropylmalate synthase, partial [Thermoanaerobaculia bacterium]|nr:2-isopropylmalate synthase [Thermoanaerobaculia bacterium]